MLEKSVCSHTGALGPQCAVLLGEIIFVCVFRRIQGGRAQASFFPFVSWVKSNSEGKCS